MNLQYHIVDETGIEPFVPELRALEKQIEYPLEDGVGGFTIDHGDTYYSFFLQQGIKVRFLIITNNNTVVGSIAGVWKQITFGEKDYTGLYAADLKLSPDFRQKGIHQKALWYLFIRWPLVKDFQGWDFVYYCTMQRGGQGVNTAFKGPHLGKLANGVAEMNIYIVDPKKISRLKFDDFPDQDLEQINLSPHRHEDLLWNDGIKNIISTTDNSLLPLGHLHPNLLTRMREGSLKKALEKIMNRTNGLACFSIDVRDEKKILWLQDHGIQTNTRCKIFSFSPFASNLRKSGILCISTGEI